MRKHQISQIFISGNRFFEFLGVFRAVKCVNIKSAKHLFFFPPEIHIWVKFYFFQGTNIKKKSAVFYRPRS